MIKKNQKVDLVDVKKCIDSQLYRFNGTEALVSAWNSGENCILTGPGGYGKSEAAALFAEYLIAKKIVTDEKPFILNFNEGMTEEKLLGGLDIKEFKESGKLEYLVYNSFANYEIVIFEELFDALPRVLLILKDILESGAVRMGNQYFPIRTKMIIACTNKGYEEVVTDRSIEALMQRFAIQKEIVWNAYGKKDYIGCFESFSNGFTPEEKENIEWVAEVMALTAADGNVNYKPSPRIAKKALNCVNSNDGDLATLYNFYKLDKHARTVNSKIEDLRAIKRQENRIKEASENCKKRREAIQSLTSAPKILSEMKGVQIEINNLKEYLKQTPLKDSNTSVKTKFEKEAGELLSLGLAKAHMLIQNPAVNTYLWTVKNNWTSVDKIEWELVNG